MPCEVAHPQTFISDYLLSGLIECGKCNAKMIGCKAKFGKHAYHTCHNYIKRGKTLETGGLDIDDLVPRIKELKPQIGYTGIKKTEPQKMKFCL